MPGSAGVTNVVTPWPRYGKPTNRSGGRGRGRRYATLQLNHAYAMLLSSQFQGFCRDLHTEAIDHLARQIPVAALGPVVAAALTQSRKLDQGNPNEGNLGSDFGRLGMQLWPAVRQLSARNDGRQRRLRELSTWRNAIGHQDFAPVGGDPKLTLATVRAWHASLDGLAKAFDRAVRAHITGLAGSPPW